MTSEIKSATDPTKIEGGGKTIQTFECPYCTFKSTSFPGYCSHKRLKHQDRLSYYCEYCNAKFCTEEDGLYHSKIKHASYQPRVLDYVRKPEEKLKVEESPTTSRKKKASDESSSKTAKKMKIDLGKKNEESVLSVDYSCCHCGKNGNKSEIEEHIKSQHNSQPFLIRVKEIRESSVTSHVEVHDYVCDHCQIASLTLQEAMHHWMSNHVTLDFKFKLCLQKLSEKNTEQLAPSKLQSQSSKPIPKPDLKVNSTPEHSSTSGSSTPINTSKSSVPIPSTPITDVEDDDSLLDLNIDNLPSLKNPETDDEYDKPPLKIDFSDTEEDMELPDVGLAPKIEEEIVYKCGYCRKSNNLKTAIELHHTQVIHANFTFILHKVVIV